jgi:methyl-accepting chemotaxis protein
LRAEYRLPPDIPDSQLSLNLPGVALGLENMEKDPIFTSNDSPLGFPIFGAITELDIKPWISLTVQPQTNSLAPLKALSRSLLLAALILTGVAGLLALSVAQIISAPITRLTEVANQFAGGNLAARAILGYMHWEDRKYDPAV